MYRVPLYVTCMMFFYVYLMHIHFIYVYLYVPYFHQCHCL